MRIAHAQMGVTDAAVSAQYTEESRLRRTEGTGEFDYVFIAIALRLKQMHGARDAIQGVLSSIATTTTHSLYRLDYASWAT
jgi:hypothetical protein